MPRLASKPFPLALAVLLLCLLSGGQDLRAQAPPAFEPRTETLGFASPAWETGEEGWFFSAQLSRRTARQLPEESQLLLTALDARGRVLSRTRVNLPIAYLNRTQVRRAMAHVHRRTFVRPEARLRATFPAGTSRVTAELP
jgi:hypothetical protein